MNTDNTDNEYRNPEPDSASGKTGIENHENEPHDIEPESQNPYAKLRRFKKASYDWTRIEWKKTGFHERVSILLTSIIAISTVIYVLATIIYVGVSIATLLQIRSASKDSGDQMKKMIKAANIQADASNEIATASERNAGAAEKFSHTAETAVEEFRKAAAQSSAASDRSAQNAERTIRQAQDSFRDEQRAWIGITYEGLRQFEPGKDVTLIASFLNSGKTPAREVKTRSLTTLMDAHNPVSIPNADQLIRLTNEAWQPAPAIAPQALYSLFLGIADPNASEAVKNALSMVRTRFEQIKSRELILYDFGELSYMDISGRHHTTTFCVYLSDPETKLVNFCPKFNDVQ